MADTRALLEKAKELPERSGVYYMKDSNDIIIYIGKSKNLKNRVSSYFYNNKDRIGKLENLVNNIRSFSYTICSNEMDALLMENRLIKKHKPRYNSLLKNHKIYPYVVFKKKKGITNMLWDYEIKEEYDEYYGPFNSVSMVENYIRMVEHIYKLKKCSNFRGKKCLEYHMGNCLAPCDEEISIEEYNKLFIPIREHLQGISDKPMKKGFDMMMEYSEKLDFSKAALLRDLLDRGKHLINYHNLINSDVYKGIFLYVLPHEEGQFKAYILRDLTVVKEMDSGTDDINVIRKDIEDIISSMRNDETAITTLKENIDEKMIVYSFVKDKGQLYNLKKDTI